MLSSFMTACISSALTTCQKNESAGHVTKCQVCWPCANKKMKQILILLLLGIKNNFVHNYPQTSTKITLMNLNQACSCLIIPGLVTFYYYCQRDSSLGIYLDIYIGDVKRSLFVNFDIGLDFQGHELQVLDSQTQFNHFCINFYLFVLNMVMPSISIPVSACLVCILFMLIACSAQINQNIYVTGGHSRHRQQWDVLTHNSVTIT